MRVKNQIKTYCSKIKEKRSHNPRFPNNFPIYETRNHQNYKGNVTLQTLLGPIVASSHGLSKRIMPARLSAAIKLAGRLPFWPTNTA